MQVQSNPRQGSSRPKTYISSWEDFGYQMVDIFSNDPIRSRLVLKFKRDRQIFILKATDGTKTILKKAFARKEFDKIQRIVETATQLLTREVPKVQEIVEDKKGPKKGKKEGKKK